jgi:hypothetical protein
MADYFVKDGVVHKNPVQGGCTTEREPNDPAHDTVPKGMEKCPKCFAGS